MRCSELTRRNELLLKFIRIPCTEHEKQEHWLSVRESVLEMLAVERLEINAVSDTLAER